MAKHAHDSGVTAEQRQEIRRLCQASNVPDKSGEMFTQKSPQRFIDDMRQHIGDGAPSR